MGEDLTPEGQHASLRSAIGLLAATIVAQAGPPSSRAEQIVARAKRTIDNHLQDPELTVGRIARMMGLSRRQLNRAFASSGQRVSRLIWEARLQRCKRDLMMERDATISEIAFRWGFSDAAHFSRAFRTAFQMSPTQYRTHMR